MTERVTDEAVEVGAAAILTRVPFGYGMTAAEAASYARAALEAAAPLIVAGERAERVKMCWNNETYIDADPGTDRPAAIRADKGGE